MCIISFLEALIFKFECKCFGSLAFLSYIKLHEMRKVKCYLLARLKV